MNGIVLILFNENCLKFFFQKYQFYDKPKRGLVVYILKLYFSIRICRFDLKMYQFIKYADFIDEIVCVNNDPFDIIGIC